MNVRVLKSMSWVFALVIAALAPVALAAQDMSKPAATRTASDSTSPSKWDIFLGYSYLAPHGTVNTPYIETTTTPINFQSINAGAIGSITYFINKNWGIQAEGDGHHQDETCVAELPPTSQPVRGNSAARPLAISFLGCNPYTTPAANSFYGGSGGIIYRWPYGTWTPFLHALVGAEDVSGPLDQPDTWGPVITAGGGLDYETPWFNHHLAIRLLQADYQYVHENFGDDGGTVSINAARLSAGIVFHIGNLAPPAPVTLSCSAGPSWVYPGDPVTVTGTAGNLSPKETAVYSWSGNGATGNGTTANVATGSLAPGSYEVKGNVKEGKANKPYEMADCTASFTVKPFEPPTISCTANPSTIKPGDTSTITSVGQSPQNRPLTYSYSAESGTVTGTDATATFNSAGAAAGPVTVNCNVGDDKGGSATASTIVAIAPPPPPPGPTPEQQRLESRLALHSVFFPTDMPRASHPEGGLLASQQGTLSTLATDFKEYLGYKPDARLTLTGHTDVRGSAQYNIALSDRRVARTKQFLVEQGVPEASIETRGLGKEQELTDAQVKDLVEQNPDLTDAQQKKVLHNLNVIVLAQNRRVDISLSTTGQQSVRLYPFNAADSMTLLSEKPPAPRKKATPTKGK